MNRSIFSINYIFIIKAFLFFFLRIAGAVHQNSEIFQKKNWPKFFCNKSSIDKLKSYYPDIKVHKKRKLNFSCFEKKPYVESSISNVRENSNTELSQDLFFSENLIISKLHKKNMKIGTSRPKRYIVREKIYISIYQPFSNQKTFLFLFNSSNDLELIKRFQGSNLKIHKIRKSCYLTIRFGKKTSLYNFQNLDKKISLLLGEEAELHIIENKGYISTCSISEDLSYLYNLENLNIPPKKFKGIKFSYYMVYDIPYIIAFKTLENAFFIYNLKIKKEEGKKILGTDPKLFLIYGKGCLVLEDKNIGKTYIYEFDEQGAILSEQYTLDGLNFRLYITENEEFITLTNNSNLYFYTQNRLVNHQDNLEPYIESRIIKKNKLKNKFTLVKGFFGEKIIFEILNNMIRKSNITECFFPSYIKILIFNQYFLLCDTFINAEISLSKKSNDK